MPVPVDYASNTLGTARAFNLSPTPGTFTNGSGSLDTYDYYGNSLSGRSSFNLPSEGITANLGAQVFSRNGTVTTTGGSATTGTDYFNSSSEIGTEYPEGFAYADVNTYFALNASTTPPDYAGNTLTTAKALTLTPVSKTFQDWVGSLDTNDYYSFSLSGLSDFDLKLDGMSANANVQLLDSTGKLLTSSTGANAVADSINRVLDTGTYYIRVFPNGTANTNYNLSVSTTPVSDITVDSNFIKQDSVGSTQPNDYYRFNLSGTNDFHLLLNGLTADADVQLLKLDSTGKSTQVGGQLGVSAASGIAAETININNLTAGSYLVRVYQFSGNTSYNLNLSTTPSVPTSPSGNLTPDWFSQNLKNPTLQSLTRSLATDGLSRDDMLAILRSAEHSGTVDGVIDATELKDLRAIVGNTSLFNTSNQYDYDYVRVLAKKIVNGDVANATYQGSALGNLYAGSSATQMEKLINKWFLGSDRPDATSPDETISYSYQYASGGLFQNGISYQDIKQGNVGDCYFLAGLGETALHSPDTIKGMFIDNGNNTYTVRFYNNGVVDYLTVDSYLPTDTANKFVYASTGSLSTTHSNELWVALAEKAYAQLDESGWIGQDNTNSYQGIAGGWDGYALNHITAGSTGYYSFLDLNSMVSYLNSGNWVGVSTKTSGVSSTVVPNHVYVVTGYDSTTQTFNLFNPWGVKGGYLDSTFKPGTIQLTYAQLVANSDGWTYAAV